MSNSEISEIIELTGKLLDLHDQDEMRAKTYLSSAFNLEKYELPLSDLSLSELSQIRGVGKLMAANIREIVSSGTLKELDLLIEKTPDGIFDMFKVKGLGVKKIKYLWNELGLDNINDLRIACENGKISGIKGFGEKTQLSILESLRFLQEQEGKLRMDAAQELSTIIFNSLEAIFQEVYEVGQVPRKCQIVDELSFLVVKEGFGGLKIENQNFIQDIKASSPNIWRGQYGENKIQVRILKVSSNEKISKKFIANAGEDHLKFKNKEGITLLTHLNSRNFNDEEEIYTSFGFPFILPEMREGKNEFVWSLVNSTQDLINYESLKGTIHNHSTYSDGSHTLEQMAEYCHQQGFQYFGIADHSQSAQYASGLRPETVLKQHAHIDQLNSKYNNFKILKGIESDILINGNLDYEVDILKTFDYVVASVHSVLNMDKEKATQRLINAIENPYTSVLGHLSGRLLLSRKGYPLDYEKVIDACAANGVVMELNASPYRLDIDWQWIEHCVKKGVWLSINPDAHEMQGIHDLHYGVAVARKAGLLKTQCLNAQPLETILKVFSKK